MKQSKNVWALRILLMLGGVSLAVCLCECFFRATQRYGAFGAAAELDWMRKNDGDLSRFYMIDPEFGFRPILGTEVYSEFGALRNKYPAEKRPGTTRILFAGDSVTYRGKIVTALQRLYGDVDYEYWNAGVESFNTVQEVAYYLRFNQEIRPDHVILTFHLNDFESTPIAFFNGDGQLVVYAPHTPLRQISRGLFEHSYIYRWIIGRTLDRQHAYVKTMKEIHDALQRLKAALAVNHTSLTVLVLPMFCPLDQWNEKERTAHKTILQVLDNLEIRHFDLYLPFTEALAEGVPLQERPGDKHHPSHELTEIFAEYLFAQDVLSATGVGPKHAL